MKRVSGGSRAREPARQLVGGVGIVQLFDFMAAPLISAGQVVELFADLKAAGPDMFAVCTAARRSAANVRAVMDALAETVA